LKISVLLCVFNGEKWIKDSVDSILNQTFKEFEFIIINDGSTDNTKRILEEYENQNSKIRLINQVNMGLTASLNYGLTIAKGKWIARIDSDDIALPQRLEKQYIYAERTNSCLVGCQAKFLTDNNKIISTYKVPNEHRKLVNNLVHQKIFFSHSSAFFKKESALKVGNYRKLMRKSQDYDLWLRMSEIGKINCTKYFGVLIRVHKDRISSKNFGLNQRIYAHCANISYLIRQEKINISDPCNPNNHKEMEYFIKFVSDQLKNYSFLEFYEKLFKHKNESSSKIFLKKFFYIFKNFNNFKLIIILIRWVIFGDYISKIIKKNWLSNKNKAKK
tara:strand:+ start:261 stop:1253 length:993 start_codon:yes stop_codon:yes gene_type:complete